MAAFVVNHVVIAIVDLAILILDMWQQEYLQVGASESRIDG